MNVHDDSKSWDTIHEKDQEEIRGPSKYAQDKEALFPKGCLVVELGGGTGEDALYFMRKGHRVVILDISDYALKVAQEAAEKEGLSKSLAVKKVDFGLHQLPITENSVEVVYSRISLNYFEKEHAVKIFQDIYKMLKPGGSAYLTFKSPADEKEMEYLLNTATEFEENVFIENGQLRSRFTNTQLEEMLKAAAISNFQVVPFEEELKHISEGYQHSLHLNEVLFTKA